MPVGLYQLHLASAKQLCQLHYSPKSIKLVQAKLKELVDHHYVQEDWTPTKRFRSPYHYVLGSEGIRYLQEIGKDTNEAFRDSKEVHKHSLFIEHHLEVNDVVISAALLKRVAPDYDLANFMHERELRRCPYKITWHGEKLTLIPDAFLDFRAIFSDGKQRRMSILLEHDRGTEEQRHFRRRIRAYILLLKSGAYKDWFGVTSITIAFTTFVGAKRLAQMRGWTRQELAATNELKTLGSSFLFTNQPQPPDPYHLWLEQCWYTPLRGGTTTTSAVGWGVGAWKKPKSPP